MKPKNQTPPEGDDTQQANDKGLDDAVCSSFLPIPRAIYPCLHEHCAEQVSYPPDMLFWADDGETRGWLCDNCWDEHDWNEGEIPPKGISLEKEIIRQQNPSTRTDDSA
jgi:hypothetical protein